MEEAFENLELLCLLVFFLHRFFRQQQNKAKSSGRYKKTYCNQVWTKLHTKI
jgi:hypothetical protein